MIKNNKTHMAVTSHIKYTIQTHVFFPLCAAAGIRVPLPEHRQRQTFTQPGPNSHQARHSADRVHVLCPVPRHDQVSDFLRQRHPQRFAGVFQEDRRKRTASGNHVDLDLTSQLFLHLVTFLRRLMDFIFGAVPVFRTQLVKMLFHFSRACIFG